MVFLTGGSPRLNSFSRLNGFEVLDGKDLFFCLEQFHCKLRIVRIQLLEQFLSTKLYLANLQK